MTNDEQTALDDLLKLEEGLSDWEVKFIDNLDKYWREKELTAKQKDKLWSMVKEKL